MGQQLYIGTDLRIASEITFIPGQTELRHHALATAICNRGKTEDGRELRDEITLNFWGKRAQNASYYLYKGKQVNIYGRLQSYTQDTGQTNANGKKILNRRVEVVVTRLELLGDSMKTIEQIVAMNIALMKNAGRLPADVVLSAAELLKSNKPKPVDFNPAVVAQSGKYGMARVWTKDHGFWDEKPGQINPTTSAPANAPDTAQLLEQIKALQAKVAGNAGFENAPAEMSAAGAGEVPDAFPVG